MGIITYADITKRQNALKTEESKGIMESCKLCYDRYENNKTEETAKTFVKECARDSRMATTYFSDLLECATTYKEDVNIQRIFTESILPMVECETLAQDTPKEWNDIVEKNQECDRIIANHEKVTKKFDIDGFCKTHYNRITTDLLADLCADTVSRYKSLNAVQKLNIAVEEFCYMAGKYGISRVLRSDSSFDDLKYRSGTMTEQSAVERIIKDIMMSEHVTEEDQNTIIEMAASLNENVMIDYKPTEIGSSQSKMFLFNKNRSTNTLVESIRACVKEADHHEVCINSFYMIEAVLSGFKKDRNEAPNAIDPAITTMLETALPAILKAYEDFWLDNYKAKSLLATAENYMEAEREFCRMYIENYPAIPEDGEDSVPNRYKAYREALVNVQESLNFMKNMVYLKENLKIIKKNSKKESPESASPITGALKGVINAVTKVKNWFASKTNSSDFIFSKNKSLKMVKNKVFKEDTLLTEFLTPDGKLDTIATTFKLTEGEIDHEIHEIFNESCKVLNMSLNLQDINCYYTTTNNLIEVHVSSNERYQLVDEDYSAYIEHDISDDDMDAVYEMMRYAALEESDIVSAQDVADYFVAHESEALEEFGTFLELASYATLEKEYVREVYEEARTYYGWDFAHKWVNEVENYQPQVDLDTESILESLDVLYSVVTERKMDTATRAKMLKTRRQNQSNPPKPEPEKPEPEKKDEVDEDVNSLLGLKEVAAKPIDAVKLTNKKLSKKQKEDKKETKVKDDDEPKSLNFNNVKLFLMGLKDKMKGLSAKEQKFCRDLDNGAERLVDSMKKALVSDRREAIIKGSVIPSLSKSIKVGIALAGTAIVNPLAAIIGAVGAFAMSKKLTKKERILLLDDIEIELEIIDKEIQNAENQNKMKKMRYLMKEKKNLQRQYARIKYNLRVGKDIVPSHTAKGGDY